MQGKRLQLNWVVKFQISQKLNLRERYFFMYTLFCRVFFVQHISLASQDGILFNNAFTIGKIKLEISFKEFLSVTFLKSIWKTLTWKYQETYKKSRWNTNLSGNFIYVTKNLVNWKLSIFHRVLCSGRAIVIMHNNRLICIIFEFITIPVTCTHITDLIYFAEI